DNPLVLHRCSEHRTDFGAHVGPPMIFSANSGRRLAIPPQRPLSSARCHPTAPKWAAAPLRGTHGPPSWRRRAARHHSRGVGGPPPAASRRSGGLPRSPQPGTPPRGLLGSLPVPLSTP